MRTVPPPSESGLKFEVIRGLVGEPEFGSIHRQLSDYRSILGVNAEQLGSSECSLVELDCAGSISDREHRSDGGLCLGVHSVLLLVERELVGDDLLQGVVGDIVVGDFADGDLAAVDEENGGLVHVDILAEFDGGVDGSFGGCGVGAGADLHRVEADFGDCVGEGRVGGLRREPVLRGEDGVSELEEGLVAGLLCDADAVGGSLVRFGVNRGQREILKDEMRLGEIAEEAVDDGLDFLAVRALEVGELDEFDLLVGAPRLGPSAACERMRRVSA